MGEFAVSIEHSEAKSVSASGGFAPLIPRSGALPLDPCYRFVLHVLAMAPLCQILNTPLLVIEYYLTLNLKLQKCDNYFDQTKT